MGCSGTNHLELLEARLREQELVVQRYEKEVAAVRSQLTVAQRESKILRQQLTKAGKDVPAVEATTALAAVETLKFNSLLTAGQNKDTTPGDEQFHAIVTPYDKAGELVKVVGKLELEAIDLSLPENQRTVGRWEFPPEKAQKLWHSGFLSSGFRFTLPWERLPQSNSVLLLVKMETPDGRELSASHTMKIEAPTQLASAAAEPAPPTLAETPPALTVSENATEITQTDGTNEVLNDKPTDPQNANPSAEPATPDKLQRPEPVLDLFEGPEPEEAPGKATISAISFETSEPVRNLAPTAETARPFPVGLKTSDNWNDATIPVLR